MQTTTTLANAGVLQIGLCTDGALFDIVVIREKNSCISRPLSMDTTDTFLEHKGREGIFERLGDSG